MQTDQIDSTGESRFENTGQHTALKSAVSKYVVFLCATLLWRIKCESFIYGELFRLLEIQPTFVVKLNLLPLIWVKGITSLCFRYWFPTTKELFDICWVVSLFRGCDEMYLHQTIQVI